MTRVDFHNPSQVRTPIESATQKSHVPPSSFGEELARPVYPDEMMLEPLRPIIDESLTYQQPALSAPPAPRSSYQQDGLPLPAPGKTSRYEVPQVYQEASRSAIPERMTLAGTSRTRQAQLQQHQVQQLQRAAPPPRQRDKRPRGKRVPEPVSEEFDRSTAINADPLAAMQTPLIGGRYRMLERIGAGGMGKVFKVAHSQLGKTFALKIIIDGLSKDEKVRELFYREARMASSLSHPNITSVVDFGEDQKLGAYMVMELLDGQSLSRILHKEKRFGVKQTCDIARQLAEALDYIHGKGIIHCDIKTENILLCKLPGAGPRKRRQVKLLDFGLAKNISGGRNTGSLAGTPHYVAPERIRGEQPSPATDIYGLGILFYEMLTGKVPWDGTVDQILAGHLHKQPIPPSRLVQGGLDEAVEKLILRALAKTPKERHKSMTAFLYELQTVMDMLGFERPGRRKRAGGAKKLQSKLSPSNPRDEVARALFDASRVPMALIRRDGSIVCANRAFAQFIMGVTVDVENLNVSTTPLMNAWGTFESDLAHACAGTSMRRVIELELEPGRMRRLLMWLDPGLNAEQAIFGVHPLDI